MPQSKKRKQHHEFHPTSPSKKAMNNRSTVWVAGIFFCLLGIGIAYFAAGVSALWLLVGAAAGAVAGYFFGLQIDRAFSKK